MKTMTCKELSGPCDKKLSATTWKEMIKKMTVHVVTRHPETAKEMKKTYEKGSRE